MPNIWIARIRQAMPAMTKLTIPARAKAAAPPMPRSGWNLSQMKVKTKGIGEMQITVMQGARNFHADSSF
jgi:hypothetical protein